MLPFPLFLVSKVARHTSYLDSVSDGRADVETPFAFLVGLKILGRHRGHGTAFG